MWWSYSSYETPITCHFQTRQSPKATDRTLSGSIVIRSADDTAQIGIAAGGLNGIILSGLFGRVAIDVSKTPDDILQANQAESGCKRLCALEKPVEWKQTQSGGLPVARPLRGIPRGIQTRAERNS